MILQSLRDLAQREGLVDDPAFESKPVRWVVRVKQDGTFIGVYDTNQIPLATEDRKGKPRPEAKMMVIPRRRGRTVNVAADFLVDKAEYALGLVPDGSPPEAKTPKRLAAFVDLLNQAHAAKTNALLAGVAAFLANDAARMECSARLSDQGGFATNDLFAFEVDGEYPQDAEDLRVWWADRNSLSDKTALRQHQCLVCGRFAPTVEKHNMIQIRGGSPSGIPVVSFNQEAFEKYGWTGSSNAPICTECMTAYVEGLRRLTKPRYVMPRTGITVGPLSTVLNGDTTAVYWDDAGSELVATLPFLRDDPEKVRDLLVSPQRGLKVRIGTADRFYCLILSGAQGRTIIRKIHTGTVAALEENLRQYFDALDVERFDRSAPMPLHRLLRSIVPQGKLDRLPPGLASELWLASLFGLPLSRLFLATLISRNCAERDVPPQRAALLQFYFAVKRTAESKTRKGRQMGLDDGNKDTPYLLGRLLAVLETVQVAAQGRNLNRTIVDRFYGAASTRPGVVFPQLLKLAQHHLSKAEKKTKGWAVQLDRQLVIILHDIEPGGFSTTLSLEQQGNFALGYYHQRYKKKDGSGNGADLVDETTTEANGEIIHDTP